jgi:Na+/proline symporter
LTGAFVPLVAGAFWKRANTQGALLSVICGIGTWLGLDLFGVSTMVPSNLLGLAASAVGMLVGSFAPEVIKHKGHSIETALHMAKAATAKH